MELSYEQYAELMDELVSEGHDVLDASEMIFSGQMNEAGVNFGGQAAVDRVRSGYAKQQQAQQQTSSRLDALRKQRFGGSSASISGAPPAPKLPSPAQADAMDRASGKPSRITSTSTPARPAVPASSPKPATASAPAKPAVPASAPTKPAVPTGTTAGGTTFQRRAATGAELRAAQAARAAGKGEEGAIKAGVEAGKSTPSRNGFGASTAPMVAQSSVSSTTSPTGFSLAKSNKQKITAGMEIQGDRLQEQLRVDNYGGSARPDSLLDAYQAIYNQ
jgi:hypothetical protein